MMLVPTIQSTLRCSSLLACLALLLSFAPAQQEEPEVRDLLAKVLRAKDGVDNKVLDGIVAAGGQDAFEALTKASGVLNKRGKLEKTFNGIVKVTTGELAKRGVDFLSKEASSSGVRQRAAVAALAKMGEPASKALEKILRKNIKDEQIAALCVRGLMDGWAAGGKTRDLDRLIELYLIGTSGPRDRLVEVLAGFEGESALNSMAKQVVKTGISRSKRNVLIDALARRGGKKAEQTLLRLLEDEDPAVVYSTLVALEGVGSFAHRSALAGLMRSKDPSVLRASFAAYARLMAGEEQCYELLERTAYSREEARRVAAAAGLGVLRDDASFELVTELLDDSSTSVRREALASLISMRRRDGVALLIERLEAETGRYKLDVARALRLLTGRDQGESAARWRAFWRAEGEDFELPTAADAHAAEDSRTKRDNKKDPGEARSATFYGHRIRSERVLFVVDASQSMKHKVRGGKTRFEVAREQLISAFEDMPDGTLFNIIFFDGAITSWQDQLVPLHDESRQEAGEFVRKKKLVFATWIYDALEEAFRDPLVDTIYFLSDGQPYGGQIDDSAIIREEVRRWNSARRIRIHSVSIGERTGALGAWLAEDSGGRHERVK